MVRSSIPLIGAVVLAASAWGAGWTEYTSGQFRVISDAGDKAAKARLAELDQLSVTLGYLLGKGEMSTVWPIQLVLFSKQSDYAPYALPQPLVDAPDSVLGAWIADMPLPHDLLRAIARQLIESNAGRMPASTDQGLVDLMATLESSKKGMTLGTAPGSDELPGPRLQAWAKFDMLATQPEFSGKLRIYLNNLQQGGDEQLASKNAFGMTAAELDKRAAAFLAAKQFTAVQPPGPPMNAGRDFDQMKIDQDAVKAVFGALKAQGKKFPPDSPRGLFEKGTKDALEQAAQANKKWAAPHAALADLHADPEGRAKELATAASLEPRNAGYWEDLAQAQEDSGKYGEADKAWQMAERNAAGAEAQAKVHKDHQSFEDRRARYEVEAQHHEVAAAKDDVDRVRKAAEARLHAAEAAANKRNGAVSGDTPVRGWLNDQEGQKLSGSLTNVDCLKGGPLRLTVKPADGAAVKLMIRDLHEVIVRGAEQASFSCGVQRPVKSINLVHDGKPDSEEGTVGNVRTVELP